MLSAIIQTEDDLRFKMYNRHRLLAGFYHCYFLKSSNNNNNNHYYIIRVNIKQGRKTSDDGRITSHESVSTVMCN